MKLLVIAAVLLALGTASGRAGQPTPDKGTLVMSGGYVGGIFGFEIKYHSLTMGLDIDKSFSGSALFDHGLDFRGDEKGAVYIEHLPPGKYELYAVAIYSGAWRVSSAQLLSIPFTISAGQTVYLGDFSAYRIMKKNLVGVPIPRGAYFVVTDKHDRDIPIAQKLEPSLQPVTLAVPDASALRSPYFTNDPQTPPLWP